MHAPADILAAAAIVQPGRNCWRVDARIAFYCIQDAADYFRLVRQALLAARKTVFILGWDITAHIDLLPGAAGRRTRRRGSTSCSRMSHADARTFAATS